MKTIKTTNGDQVLVDDEDYSIVASKKWRTFWSKHNRHNFYARCSGVEKKKNGKRIYISSGMLMHRFILGLTDPTVDVDHINQNGLDNRKANLRIVTRSDNCKNKRACGSSQYLGVYWAKDRRKWRVEIKTNGGRIGGGQYINEKDAARAYDKLALIHHGEFANLNFKTNKE